MEVENSDKIVTFIGLVRKHPVIWNINYPQYKNLGKKMEAWRRISSKCGVPVNICKKKWKALRDSYARKLYKMYKSGLAYDDSQCTWRYTESMKFIRDHIKSRKTGEFQWVEALDGEMSAEAINNDETVFSIFGRMSPDQDLTMDTSYTDEKLHAVGVEQKGDLSIEETLLDTIKSVQTILNKQSSSSTPPDNSTSTTITLPSLDAEDELFLRFILEKLKSMPLQVKNDTKVALLQYVNEVESNILKSVPAWDKYLKN